LAQAFTNLFPCTNERGEVSDTGIKANASIFLFQSMLCHNFCFIKFNVKSIKYLANKKFFFKRWQNCSLWQVLVCTLACATCQCGLALKQKMRVGKK